jgi:hypothetical protein
MKSILRLRELLEEYVPDAFVNRPDDEPGSPGKYPAVPLWFPGQDSLTASTPEEVQGTTGTAGIPRFEFAPESEVDIDSAIGDSLRQEIRRAALVRGVDGLAWYVSFHVRGPQWGIYLPISSVVGVAMEVFGDLQLTLPARLRLAAHVLHQHELFHFSVDCMTQFWELSNLKPLWKPGRTLRGNGGYYHREEKLANAYMLRQINTISAAERVPGRAKQLRQFVHQQPEGYRDAPSVVSGPRFRSECNLLSADFAEIACDGQVTADAQVPVLLELLRLQNRLDWRECPVHVIHDENRFSLPFFYANLFSTVLFIQETAEFAKDLATCDAQVKKAWVRAKKKLGVALDIPGLDFTQWSRNGSLCEYSVRVDRRYRAHLLFDYRTSAWSATRIGSHSETGHG